MASRPFFGIGGHKFFAFEKFVPERRFFYFLPFWFSF